MGWHIFEKLLEKVANYSPFVGKIWILFIFIFRLIIVTSVGDTIYEDEQAEFECNTNDPGCRQFCFTKFTPISQIRFFAMQLLLIGTPSMCFIVYTLHKITMLPPQQQDQVTPQQDGSAGGGEGAYRKKKVGSRRRRRRRRNKIRYLRDHLMINPNQLPRYKDVVVHPETQDELITKRVHLSNGKLKASKELLDTTTDTSDSTLSSSDEENFENPSASNKLPVEDNGERKKKVKTKTVHHPDGSDEIFQTKAISRAYFIQAILRFCIEGGFIYVQYTMYGFEVNWFYDCTGEPCTKEIRCYVSRPKEKTYLLLFMYAMAAFSMLLNVLEIGLIIYEYIRKKNSHSKSEDHVPNTMAAMPLTQIITTNRQNPGAYAHNQQRALNLNTFPNLGPFPLPRDNSVGGSTRDVVASDTGGYYY